MPSASLRTASAPQPAVLKLHRAKNVRQRELHRDLRYSKGDGTAYGVMVGAGETFIPAFVLAVGLGDVFSGLIASVPLLLGSILQLISPAAIARLGSHQRWVVLCSIVQAICFVPLIVAAWIGAISAVTAMVIAAIYWGTSLGTGPAWNTWQSTIIPRSIRANFFARRARMFQAATLGGFLAGGFILQTGNAWGEPVAVFMVLFGIAGVMRGISAWCLANQSEPFPIPPDMERLTIREQFQEFTRGSVGPLLVFIVVMQIGVHVSGPYFVPYMLKDLQLSYIGYVVLIGVSYAAKFMTLPMWGRYAQRVGSIGLLWAGSLSVVPLAAGWCVSREYWWLLGLQWCAGTAWGAYELAITLLFLDAIPESKRTSVLTLYNVLNNVSLCVGSLIGAVILQLHGVSTLGYMMVFAVSSLLRLATLPLIIRMRAKQRSISHGKSIDDAAQSTHNSVPHVAFDPVAIRPGEGSVDETVLVAVATHAIPPNTNAAK